MDWAMREELFAAADLCARQEFIRDSTGAGRPGRRTRSMRRTKVAQIYRKIGNLRAVQLLLGNTKMDSTVRYFFVDLEDALAIAKIVEL